MALRVSCDQKVAYSKMLYKNHGMVLDRHSFRMEIEFEEAPAPPVIPEGMIIRQFAPESELEMLARTYLDSFRDLYGFAEVPLAKQVENIQFLIDNDPHYDPELWFLAMDGEEAAGFSLCFFQTTEDPEMGWVVCWGGAVPGGAGSDLLCCSIPFGSFTRVGASGQVRHPAAGA